MRAKGLLRYMIASFLLARGQPNSKYQISTNALEEVALPLALQDLSNSDCQPDVFCQLLKAIYEDYDLDKAIGLVEEMGKQSGDDFLLQNYTFDIKKQAYILIFQSKCKLYRTVDIEEVSKLVGSKNQEGACEDIQRHLSDEGFNVEIQTSGGDKGTISCQIKRSLDTEQMIQQRAYELF